MNNNLFKTNLYKAQKDAQLLKKKYKDEIKKLEKKKIHKNLL